MKLKEKNNLVMKKERKVFPKSQIFEKGTYFLLSLVFATGSVMGMGSPFAIAFISVCSKSNFIFSAVGAVLGYVVSWKTGIFEICRRLPDNITRGFCT